MVPKIEEEEEEEEEVASEKPDWTVWKEALRKSRVSMIHKIKMPLVE